MKQSLFLVEVIEKFSDTPIKFKCKSISEEAIIEQYKLNGPDIVSYKITYIKE